MHQSCTEFLAKIKKLPSFLSPSTFLSLGSRFSEQFGCIGDVFKFDAIKDALCPHIEEQNSTHSHPSSDAITNQGRNGCAIASKRETLKISFTAWVVLRRATTASFHPTRQDANVGPLKTFVVEAKKMEKSTNEFEHE